MAQLSPHLTPDLWLGQIVNSREALSGGVVKRQIRDVERLVGRERFVSEIERRGFHALENRRHFVIFCNREPIRHLR